MSFSESTLNILAAIPILLIRPIPTIDTFTTYGFIIILILSNFFSKISLTCSNEALSVLGVVNAKLPCSLETSF